LRLLLLDWKERWDEYLKEKNVHGKLSHLKVLKAYKSLLKNIPYLETYEVKEDL